jgi:hypothetical protein
MQELLLKSTEASDSPSAAEAMPLDTTVDRDRVSEVSHRWSNPSG